MEDWVSFKSTQKSDELKEIEERSIRSECYRGLHIS